MTITTQVRYRLGFNNILCNIYGKLFIKLIFLIVLCVNFSKSVDYCNEHFENCTCTDEKVECHHEAKLKGDITVLFHYIKDNITDMTITGCDLKELPQNTLGSCSHDKSLRLDQLKRVDLSGNNILIIHRKSFHCVRNLETLILRDNAWEVDRNPNKAGFFTAMPNLKHLDLTNAFDDALDGNIHYTKLGRIFTETDMSKLETLKLGYNELYLFTLQVANSFCDFTSLKTLDLSNNYLIDPVLPDKNDCFEHLELIDLSYNKMQVLPNEFMDKAEHLRDLKQINLDYNPFYCDCGLIETWKWLKSTKLNVNKNGLKCAGGYLPSYRGKPILSLTLSELRCNSFDSPDNSAIKTVSGTAVTFVVLAFFLA